MIFLNEVEQFWLVSNCLVTLMTVAALIDAIADRNAVRLRNGMARTITARANVRREVIRLVIQALLIAVIIPRALIDDPAVFTPGIVILLCVPLVLLLNTILDARTRRQLAALSLEQIEAERTRLEEKMDALAAQGADLSAQVTVGTVAATAAAGKAQVAATRAEASVVDAASKAKESFDAAMATYLSDEPLRATIEGTAEQVHDIHDRVVLPKDVPR